MLRKSFYRYCVNVFLLPRHLLTVPVGSDEAHPSGTTCRTRRVRFGGDGRTSWGDAPTGLTA